MSANTMPGQRTCIITGARGYLGSCMKERFERGGWRVVELTRFPGDEDVRAGRAIPFHLGEDIPSSTFQGAEALVHCAHDFSLRDWREIRGSNVVGADRLFQSAETAGVPRKVFISSMSAYEGCKSLYGRAKLEVEKRLGGRGVLLLRPGLIYGDHPRGIFSKLVKQVEGSRPLPLFDGGRQIQYLTHQDDLSEVIFGHAVGTIPLPREPDPVTAAHEQGWTIRAILEELARARGRQLRFIRLPWRMVWLALKTCEVCRLPLDFRSDSLVSLMHQNPRPSFELTRRLGLGFRPFQPGIMKF